MSEIAQQSQMEASIALVPMSTEETSETAANFTNDVESWDEAELFKELFGDDELSAAHEDTANTLLEEYERSEAEQQARDELAAKALNLITSAIESPLSDAGRKMELVNQLIARIGHLCNGHEVQKVVDKLSPKHNNRQGDQSETEDDTEEAERSHPFAGVTKRAGSLALNVLRKSLSERLRKWFVPFVRSS